MAALIPITRSAECQKTDPPPSPPHPWPTPPPPATFSGLQLTITPKVCIQSGFSGGRDAVFTDLGKKAAAVVAIFTAVQSLKRKLRREESREKVVKDALASLKKSAVDVPAALLALLGEAHQREIQAASELQVEEEESLPEE